MTKRSEGNTVSNATNIEAERYWRTRTMLEFVRLAAWIVFESLWDNIYHC
jgi:hypothetical protein